MLQERQDKNYNRVTLYILVGVIITLVLVIFIRFTFLSTHDACDRRSFRYVNPDVICGSADIISKENYNLVRKEIMEMVAAAKNDGEIEDFSLYFRDLVRGPVFGINEMVKFSPASLLKLPIAFAVFNLEEENPGLLQERLRYHSLVVKQELAFPPAMYAEQDRFYTIEELTKMMLVYSDNISYKMIVEYLNSKPGGTERILEVFQEIGMIDPRDELETSVSTRGYASLFRLLYNSSYLSKEHSEQILSWLNESMFDAGLVAGVPRGLATAHKFGERFDTQGEHKWKQLQDCGIVYYPENPYELCIMVRGQDWKVLSATIEKASRMVYTEVESRRY